MSFLCLIYRECKEGRKHKVMVLADLIKYCAVFAPRHEENGEYAEVEYSVSAFFLNTGD
jgi:hypothetical protein